MSDINSTIGWGIIGRSSGLQTKTAGCFANFDIKNLVDLHNTYINLYPNTELFCFFREIRNKSIVSYYLNYRPAKEIKSDRNGAFYGSVVVLVNSRSEPEIIFSILEELSDYLGEFINNENKFIKNVEDIEIINPASLSQLSSSLTPISQMSIGNKEGFMLLENLDRNSIFKFFSDAENINTTQYFSKVYASNSKEIEHFVKSRDRIIEFKPATLKLQLEIDQLKSEKIAFEKNLLDVSNEKSAWQQNYSDLFKGYNSLQEESKRLEIKIRKLQDESEYISQIENLLRKISQLESEKIKGSREFEKLEKKYHRLKQQTASGSKTSNQDDYEGGGLKKGFDDMAKAIMKNSGKLILPILLVIAVCVLIYFIYYYYFLPIK